jgi:hypothetical protein
LATLLPIADKLLHFFSAFFCSHRSCDFERKIEGLGYNSQDAFGRRVTLSEMQQGQDDGSRAVAADTIAGLDNKHAASQIHPQINVPT